MFTRNLLARIEAGNAAMLARFGITPLHPRTGMAAVGVINGKPVWPAMGGSEPAPEAPPADPPKTDPPADPPADPPKDETDWKAEARKWENRAKAKQTTADEKAVENARKEVAQQIAKALGLVEDEPDPAKLTAQIETASSEAKQAKLELAVFQVAATENANASALLDSRSFLAALNGVESTDTDAIKSAVADAVKANPSFAVKAEDPKPDPKKPVGRPAESLKPGAVPDADQRPKSLADAISAHYQN